ncbi:MAG TPA: GNAT family N-acetyltransferase [Opitutaceae bacterium]|nr:GNAT family N-acetyltransferase [Opitutaceae bacterium]
MFFDVNDILAIRTELIASTFTAVVILTARSARKRYQNWSISRRYPVGGDYITYYEDERRGAMQWRKATLRLTQRGFDFTAATRNLDDGREWTLEGKILPNGYLSGTYGHLDPNDPSKGSFFLEPDLSSSGLYQGHWSGYDSINRKITSGKYTWRKIQRVVVRKLTPSDSRYVDEIVAIFSDALGDRFITREKVKEFIAQNGGTRCLLGGFMGKKLVAVRTVSLLNDREVADFIQQSAVPARSVLFKNHRVGMLSSAAVRKEFRRRGIGTQMVDAGLQLLRDRGCTMCVSISWESGSIESSKQVLEASGFELVSTVPNHWQQDSVDRGYECPNCGGPPCTCAASFYRKRL